MALVGSFCIDRHEAHLVLSRDPQRRHPSTRRPFVNERYRAASAKGVKPQGYLSRFEAEEACKNAGKRLCRAREWQEACRGSAGSTYPYGAEEIRGRCNTRKGHLPVKVFGAKTPLYKLHYNSPKLNEEPGFLAKTGEYEGCVNDYGVYDMVGNLHEWVADDVSRKLKDEIDIPYGDHLVGPRGSGVFVGGYFSSKNEHGKGCSYITTNHAPDYHDYSIGFRCCSSPAAPP